MRLLDADSPNAACRAAGLILDHAVKASELLDLTERIRRLEGMVPHQGHDRPGAPGKTPLARVERLEARIRGACETCADAEHLGEELAAARRRGDPESDHCPRCGRVPQGDVWLRAHLIAARIAADLGRPAA